jgi:two-component system chemotaxis response regulator CheB
MKTINVMVVDDSAVVRKVVGAMLESAPGIHLLHAVSDPLLAIERMKQPGRT